MIKNISMLFGLAILVSACGESGRSVDAESFRDACVSVSPSADTLANYDATAKSANNVYSGCNSDTSNDCEVQYAMKLLRAVEACGGECPSVEGYRCHEAQ